MLTNKQGQKLIKTIERLHLKKQLNDDQPIKKYSVHVTLWGEETHREKWKHLIMKRKEHTATMRLSKEQITHLKSLGEDENIGNYDGDYKLIKNGSEEYDEVLDLMDEEDKIYYQQLASLIEYISLDEFVHVKVKKYNLLKNNLKSELSETINNKAIDYKGKTLQELIKSNQLPRKFKNDACVYNTLIQMYDGVKQIKLDKKKLSYENLYEFFNNKPYKPRATLGVTVEQLKSFFEHFSLECTFLNAQNQIVYKYKPEYPKRIKNRHFKAIITNNHIFPIINQLNKWNSKELNELKTNDYYNMQAQKEKNEIYIKDKEELFTLPIEEKKFYTIYYGGNLTEILKWLKYDLKYHPEVRYSSSINNIYLKINQSIVNITNHDASFDETRYKELGAITEINYMKLFKKYDNEFMKTLLSRQYLTEYSNSLQYNLYNFPINCAIGTLNKKSKYAIDFVKAYSSILYQSSFIPVATPFDAFEKYNDEEICQSYLYAIRIDDTFENRILSDTRIRLTYGVNLLKIMQYQKVRILFFCKLNKTVNNQLLPPLMDKIMNSNLNKDDQKFIFNKGIGLTGKKHNQASKSGIYDDVTEASHYLSAEDTKNFPKNIRDTELWYIEQRGVKKPLKNGFYLIQALIYDTMRTKLYIMAEELKKQNIEVTAVKTDCIYTFKKPDLSKLSFQVGDTFGSIKNIVEDKFETKSELKMHDLDENCCDNCQAKCVVIGKRSVKVKYVKPQEFNKIELDDEFDNKEFNKLMNKTLIRADLAGAGKTTNTIMYYQSIGKKVLVVCPTNVLALDIQTKFDNVVAITFCNFAGLIVGEEAKTKKVYDLSPFDVILIDEIYNLTTYHLSKLNKIMKENDEKIFIATGDNLQNAPIETINDTTIYNKIIKNMFPNHLQLHQSRRLTDKKQKDKLLKLKEFIFTQFETMPRRQFLKQLEEEFNISINKRTNLKTSTNITLFNSTAVMVCQNVLSKIDKKKINCKNFNWCKDIDCFVKNRMVTKDHTFHTNYVYKIIDINKDEVKLKDEFSKKEYTIETKRLDKNFRPYFSLTGHSTQGITTDKILNIFDTESKFMTARWIWTAITRTTDLNKVNLIIRQNGTQLQLKYNFDRMIEGYKEQDIFAGREFKDEDFVTEQDIRQMFNNQKVSDRYDGNNISIDRLNNVLAHVKGNIQITCVNCNVTKH